MYLGRWEAITLVPSFVVIWLIKSRPWILIQGNPTQHRASQRFYGIQTVRETGLAARVGVG
jgi:hypothetical protein